MTIIIFIIILGLLVLVHELGHFLAAKKAGVRVEEFGFGYPPRALIIGRKWGTIFSLNWIPFGGFVKIFGENYEEAESLKLKAKSENSPTSNPQPLSFVEISKKWQALILVAGVTFNLLFAWLLFSLGFLIGLPTPVENDFGATVTDPVLTIIEVLPDSPADLAGLKSGDKIQSIYTAKGETRGVFDSAEISTLISQSEGEVQLMVLRGSKPLSFDIIPVDGLVDDKKAIGISMDMVGTLTLPLHQAFYEGGKTTYRLTQLTVAGLADLLVDAIRGEADTASVTGPIGIVGLVGDASRLGFTYLITFTALISINLAIINLVPFPALDGGRLLFVAIEALTRRPINKNFAQVANTTGFALLIGLMIFVTYRDIVKLF